MSETPTFSGATPTLLERARALIHTGRLAAVPIAALAAGAAPEATAQMTVDYSAMASYSSSGFFTSVLFDDDAASGNASGNTAQLGGNKQVTDLLFWRYDDNQEKFVPRGDTTGLVFFWGGALPGQPASTDDGLSLSYSFSIDFTHTIANQWDDANINYTLILGYTQDPYVLDPGYPTSPRNGGGHYTEFSDAVSGADATSHLEFSGTITTEFLEWAGAGNYWYVQLAVNWQHEYAASRSWNNDYSKFNGDEFEITIPEGGFVVNFVPAAVPEPAHAALIFGGVGLFATTALRRRRTSKR